MPDRNPFTFTLRRFLLVPIAFAVVFAVLPTVGSTIPAFVSAIAVSGIVFLVNKENWHRVVTCMIACVLGIFFTPYEEPRSGHYRMDVDDAVLIVSYKVIFGIVTIYLLVGFVRKVIFIRRYARDDGRPENAANREIS